MRHQIYSPDSDFRHPLRLLGEACRDLCSARDLTGRMFLRSLRSRYRKSYFGYLWFFFPSLTTTLTFVLLKNQGILRIDQSGQHYPAYVFLGTILWQLFCDVLQSPLRLVRDFGQLMTKLKFPHEALMLSGVMEAGLEFLLRYVFFLAVYVMFFGDLGLTALLVPLAALSILTFALALGVLMVPLGILYSDVERGVVLLLGLWFFLTPIVYSPLVGAQSWLTYVNPVSPLLVSTRQLFFSEVLSMPLAFGMVSGFSLLLLFLSWLLYRVATPIVIERMG